MKLQRPHIAFQCRKSSVRLHLVIGPPRSGTTLLTEILCSSSAETNPVLVESNWLAEFNALASFGRHQYNHVHKGYFSGEVFRKSIRSFNWKYISSISESYNRNNVVLKSPLFSKMFSDINFCFGGINLRVYVIVRNPVDCIASMFDVVKRSEGRIFAEKQMSRRDIIYWWAGYANGLAEGLQSLELASMDIELLHYEALVRNPEGVISDLSAWSGLSLTSRNAERKIGDLDIYNASIDRTNAWWTDLQGREISSCGIGRGENLLTIEEKELLKETTAPFRTMFSYEHL